MSDARPAPRKPRPYRLVALAALGAATALVVAALVFNLTPPRAGECPAQPAAAAEIDAAAVGQLAALNGTGGGRSYADLAFITAEGGPLTIHSFAGRKLLVNFWASWCVPCRAEMPELDALAARYNSDRFMVLPINLDTGEDGLDQARAFLAEGGWANLPLYADPTLRAFDRLKAEAVSLGLPTTLLLDERGCELAVLQGPAKWDSEDGRNVIEALLST